MTRPIAAAIAVLAQDDAFLLVRRHNPPDAGLWGYPGGKIERGETIPQAACRELHEETGIVARACSLLTPFDVLRHDADGTVTAHFILLPVACRWVSGVACASSDAQEAGWFSMDQLTRRPDILSDRVLGLAMEWLRPGKRRQGPALHPLKAEP